MYMVQMYIYICVCVYIYTHSLCKSNYSDFGLNSNIKVRFEPVFFFNLAYLQENIIHDKERLSDVC